MKKGVALEEAAGYPLADDIREIIPGEFKGAAFLKGHISAMEKANFLEITPAATKAMSALFVEKDKGPVRISMLTGGCGIRFFGVAAAEDRLSDERFDIDGFTYLVEGKLLQDFAPIKIDSDGVAFRLSGAGIHPPSACGTCAFGCSPRGKIRCDGICRRCPTPCPTGRRILAKRKQLVACT